MLSQTYRFDVTGTFDDGVKLGGYFAVDFDNLEDISSLTANSVTYGSGGSLTRAADGRYQINTSGYNVYEQEFFAVFTGIDPTSFDSGQRQKVQHGGGLNFPFDQHALTSSSLLRSDYYFQTRYGSNFYIDGSQGKQSLIGTGNLDDNAINTREAAGSGAVIVDFTRGTVTKGGQLDATLQNIGVVQTGADPSIVLGFARSGASGDTPALIYGGSGPLTVTGQGATDVIQGGSGGTLIYGGGGNEIFYSRGGHNAMQGGTAGNFLSAGPNVGDTDVFYGSSLDKSGYGKIDAIYGHGGALDVLAGNSDTYLAAGSGYNELDGRTATMPHYMNLVGSNGTDLFYGGPGQNRMDQGSGTDTFFGGSGDDDIHGGSGRSFVYGGSGSLGVITGSGSQYVKVGSGEFLFRDAKPFMQAGRLDYIDNFAGSDKPEIALPTSTQGMTTFQSLNGGTAIVTAVARGQSVLYVAGADVATVQAHTQFTLEDWRVF